MSSTLRPLTQSARPSRPRVVANVPVIMLSCAMLLAMPAGGADKGAVTDGSAVLTVGRLHLNITNFGLLGSRYSVTSTYSNAPSCQWPGGTGHEYLYGAGLWVGARRDGRATVSCAQPISEFSPPAGLDGGMFEARSRTVVRPAGSGAVSGTPGDLPDGDDDGDGRRDEDPLDGRDNDGDGLIDEDFAQRGAQMFSCLLLDDTPLVRQLHPDHRPLGLRVRQEACAWDDPGYEDIIGVRFIITNTSNLPLEDVYVGLFVDADIARHDDGSGGGDDLAGSFVGLIRQPEGYFEDHAYAWMRDADPHDALPGWLGVTLDGGGLGDNQAVHPEQFGVNAIRIVSMESVGGRTGLPFGDADRYELLRRPGRDDDLAARDTGNHALILSVGPYATLKPGQHVVVDAAFTVAAGASELQRKMRLIRDVSDGRWYNSDGWFTSGGRGRETLICAEDFYTPWNDPRNPIYSKYNGYWQDWCRTPGVGPLPYAPGDLSWDYDLQKHCMWVSLDNCDECRRYHGVECTGTNGYSSAPCWSDDPRALGACTGNGGREARLPWTSGVSLPPSPWVRAVARDRAVEIYWDDRSEHRADELTGQLDFESYRVWQAADWSRPAGTDELTGPPSDTWTLEAEFDVVNHLVGEPGGGPRPFGANTGLERIVYRPSCLDDPRFVGLQDAMSAIVLADTAGVLAARPRLRDRSGQPLAEFAALLPWEHHPDVLDTMFAVTERPADLGVPKRGVRYYRYVDRSVHNGFIYFYAVTATDHLIDDDGHSPAGAGSGRLPSGAFVAVVPRTAAQFADSDRRAYVYPNPATTASLAAFQALDPSPDDPSGVRVAFANLPHCRSTISVFTLAGDLVATIEHDGSNGAGQASWNLISRNGQAVASGIYLFTVEPHQGGFERATGKFVVVR